MQKVRVKASSSYDVVVSNGILGKISEHIKKLVHPSKIMIVTDSTVNSLYGKKLLESLKPLDAKIYHYVFKPGEKSKTFKTYLNIINKLKEANFARTDLVIGFGGGIPCDIAGFVASTYLRSVPLIMIPTTLLAAVDASVGGKNGVNLEGAKNQVGTVYQPRGVFIDTDVFSTLGDKIFNEGLSEVIKYTIIENIEIDKIRVFDILEHGINAVNNQIEDIVAQCVMVKANIVSKDEFDNGLRQVLNLGHTFAHSIEALSRGAISHGAAVAKGIQIATKISNYMGYMPEFEAERIYYVLNKYHLLDTPIHYTPKQIMKPICYDKKIRSDKINVIIPHRLGDVQITPLTFDELEDYLFNCLNSAISNMYEFYPARYAGTVFIPSSKSELHRMTILGAYVKPELKIRYFGSLCDDVRSTVECMRLFNDEALYTPYLNFDVGESGTTLRFLIPRIGITGIKASIVMHGRLSKRPLDDFLNILHAHGMSFKKDGDVLHVSGKLKSGSFVLPGNVSSQYISALLLTLPFIKGDSVITIKGKIESLPYIFLTIDILNRVGVVVDQKIDDNGNIIGFNIKGSQKVDKKAELEASGDYSSATFFACIGALSEDGIYVRGLDPKNTYQGDKQVFDIIKDFGANVKELEDGYFVSKGEFKPITIDASNIPDSVPALACLFAYAKGRSVINGCARLRLKESDRIKTTLDLLHASGVIADVTEDSSIVIDGGNPTPVSTVNTYNDHRIAMAAAVIAAGVTSSLLIDDATCVDKSYPDFFYDLESLVVETYSNDDDLESGKDSAAYDNSGSDEDTQYYDDSDN